MSENVSKLLIPPRVYLGPRSLEMVKHAASDLRARKAFVVTDREVKGAGLLEQLLGKLDQASIKYGVFDETEPEPTVKCIEDASAAMISFGKADVLMSLGGGSVMDTAKSANIVAMNGGSILDYEDGISAQRKVRKLLPQVAIPTTAGTGSEATVWAVFIDPERRFKTAVQDPGLIPEYVVLDPEMSVTMPPKVTAATGMDALTHAIEAYVCASPNPLTEAMAERAIKIVSENLRVAVKRGRDLDARMNMLLASYMAGVAFSNSSLGIVHTLAEAIGGYYRVPHGVTNSLMLPHVMEFNRSARVAKFARIAELMGQRRDMRGVQEQSLRAAQAARRLSKDIGMPQRLREVGVLVKDFPALLEIANKWANLSGNPREVTYEQLEKLYNRAY